MTAALIAARVSAAHGRNYLVKTAQGLHLPCFTRGKKSEVACGDEVLIRLTGDAQGVIESIQPRRNLLYRSDQYRHKLLAANVDLMLIVLATEPSFSEDLLGRALAAAVTLNLPAMLLLNKADLPDVLPTARARLALYARLGYAVHEVSARTQPESTTAQLRPLLAGKATLLLGQSGMGKSTLLNLLVPDAQARTREISEALQTGKHTTTDSRLYDLPHGEGAIIDTPGFQEFGLAHLTPGQIERAFPEFAPYLGHCRFYNCTHLAEPGCAIRGALEQGLIEVRRYDLFCSLNRERKDA